MTEFTGLRSSTGSSLPAGQRRPGAGRRVAAALALAVCALLVPGVAVAATPVSAQLHVAVGDWYYLD
jgi:hypothetical protein